MRIAIIQWFTRSVGGIATHLNSWRTAAIRNGDECDILISKNNSSKPRVFGERKWTYGGDTRIWIDGVAPHGERIQETCEWLQDNYDAVIFGFVCPHPCPTYKEPKFLPLYTDVDLPKLACVMDGYWHEYAEWAELCIPCTEAILCPLDSYAIPVREAGHEVFISPFPFQPMLGKPATRSKTPNLIWPNQWKNIKGVTEFLEIVPQLPKEVSVDLYSSGIRYYQLRTTGTWKAAVKEDKFSQYNGQGRAIYHANVDIPQIAKAYQKAWFTVNLQGMKTRKETYRKGSYNNTEVEAMYYGAYPILHSSTLQTDLPEDCYSPVDSADEIPLVVKEAIKSGFAIDPKRQQRAREFILNKHLASDRYQEIRGLLQ